MQGNASPARLIVADDHVLVREGIRAMLAREPDLEVVGEATNGGEALVLCRALRPDLVLMDVRMPGMDGISATREIKARCPKTSVLMVTTHENPSYLMDAIKAGAAGYVLKEASRDQLTNAVRKTLEGDSPLDQKLAMRLIQGLANQQAPQPPARERQDEIRGPSPGPLTARELDVLRLLTVGKTNRQIAAELHLSLSTVKGHLERLIKKLEVSDRTQAAVRAVELGLLPQEEQGEKRW